MSYSATVTLGSSYTGNTNIDNFTIQAIGSNGSTVRTTYATGVTRAALAAGYGISGVEATDTYVRVTSSGTCVNSVDFALVGATPTPTPTAYQLYTADRYSCNTSSGPCTFVETLQIANPTVLIEGKYYYDNLNSYIFNIVGAPGAGAYLYTNMSGLGTNNCSSLCNL